MQVLTREICEYCDGTGKNSTSEEDAKWHVLAHPHGVMFSNSQTNAERIHDMTKCSKCSEGYVESWISLNELVSTGF